jgi:hypothetical protein
MRRLLTHNGPVLTLLFCCCCSSSFTIQPLIGDDPEIVTMIGASGGATAPPAQIAVTERFYRALRSGNVTDMWALLSADTRVALNTLARRSDSNGKALLKTRRFPAANKRVKAVNLSALFLVRRPTAFTAADAPGPADAECTVVVSNSRGNLRKVALRRESGAWRIHHTDFKDLPSAADESPKLLPQDQPKPAPRKVKAPTPKPMPAIPTRKKPAIDF